MNEKKNDITWKLMRVDEIGDVISGGTPSTTNPDYWDGKIPFITPLDLSKNGGAYISNVQRYITEKGLENSSANLLPPNSLAISSRAPIGYLSLCETTFVTNQGCKSVNFNKNQSPIFHYYNFQLYVNEMKKYGVGTTFSEISKGDLCRLQVNVPEDIIIQENIAQILTTCDKVIQQTEAVIAKYKAIKQGMLHDLFTRGLDGNGKLRPTPTEASELYKESELGLIPKKWEVMQLRNFAIIHNGIDYKKNPNGDIVPIYGTGGILGYTSMTLNQGPAVLSGRKGSINSPYYVEGGFWNVDTIFCIKTINDNNTKWLYYAIEQIDMLKYSEATGVPSITSKTLYNIYFSVPSHQEQIEIVNYISSFQIKIQSEEKVLKKYIAIKKGLMKKLLR
ncbi:MAG: restriction endonuclease subunit S [Parabacteroides sp.]|nr:restriction endonuclease subunit S [Parabacteroides sp.]